MAVYYDWVGDFFASAHISTFTRDHDVVICCLQLHGDVANITTSIVWGGLKDSGMGKRSQHYRLVFTIPQLRLSSRLRAPPNLSLNTAFLTLTVFQALEWNEISYRSIAMLKIANSISTLFLLVTVVFIPRAGAQRGLENLTPEERNRRAEDWTEAEARAKGWIPYGDDALQSFRSPEGRRWPQNDPSLNGSCVTYSFMPSGAGLESGEGSNVFQQSMPACATQAVQAALATWAAAADLHFKSVTDGGGSFDNEGSAGLVGDIRIAAAASIGGSVLAHAYYPPPNGISAAGDLHFSASWDWVCDPNASGSQYDIQTVALHELGHSLGLDHNNTVAEDVMFPYYTVVQRSLSANDISNIVSIYGSSGHSTSCWTVPPSRGACSTADGCRDNLTEAECAAIGGVWQGAGTTCANAIPALSEWGMILMSATMLVLMTIFIIRRVS
jgi:hypothetical protein